MTLLGKNDFFKSLYLCYMSSNSLKWRNILTFITWTIFLLTDPFALHDTAMSSFLEIVH